MDERLIYMPQQSPDASSPVDEVDSEQCLFDDLPFLAYEKEEEVTETTTAHADAASQASSFCYWHPRIKTEDDVAAEFLVDSYNVSSKKDTWTCTGDICYILPKTETVSPHNRRRTNITKKDRTPRTALKMMERHRENERTRHHNLNDSLSEICKKVPGSCQDGRETKVVMMQRIISYVAYLENTIVNLCSELGISYTNVTSLTPLTLQLRKEMEKKSIYDEKGYKQVSSTKENRNKEKKTATSRRLKLSSPTIDSTSDHRVPVRTLTGTDKQDGSQDSMVPSSTFIPLINDNALSPWLVSTQDEEVVETCEYAPLFSQATAESNCLHIPLVMEDLSSPRHLSTSHLSHVVPSSLDFLSSPDQREDKENITTFNLGGNIMNIAQGGRFGSERDTSFDPDMPDSIAVSPDTVLPTVQIPSSSSAFFSPVQSASLWYKPTPWTPAAKKNKRKQYTPKRSPFSNISNMSESIENKTGKYGGRYQEDSSSYEDGSEEPEDVSLQSLGLTRHQKAEIALLEARRYRPSSSRSEGSKDVATKSGKTDLRKASWMNGFMMFSRLNRRKFINANPGVHTSNISKIMGHAWRNMSPEEQNPYREKAKLCARELQKQQELPEEFSAVTHSISSTRDKSSFFDTRASSANSYLALHLDDST